MADAGQGVGGVEVAVVAADAVEVDRFGKPVDLDVVVELTAEQRVAFVEYVRENKGCSKMEACKAVGVRRKDVKALLKSDSEFDEDYRDARGYGDEQIFRSLVEQGIEGVWEPVVSAGKVVEGPDGKPLMRLVRDVRATQWLANGMTGVGKAMQAGKLGIEISGPEGGPIPLQAGVPLAAMAQVLLDAGVDLSGLAAGYAGEIEGEIVGEEDVSS